MVGKITLGESIRRVTLKVAGVTHQINATSAQLLNTRLYPTSDLQDGAHHFSKLSWLSVRS